MARAEYLRKLNKIIATEGPDSFQVKAKLAVLDKNFALAENILIQHDEIEEAMMMYQGLHRWDESIKIAERYKHQDVAQFKTDYFKWLLETN